MNGADRMGHCSDIRSARRPRGLQSRPVQAIQTLNPYNSAWLIKARIASKGQLRSFLRQGQPTSVFTIELVDAQVSSWSPLRVGYVLFRRALHPEDRCAASCARGSPRPSPPLSSGQLCQAGLESGS